MHISELKHRLKNSFTAAFGATGISLLSLFRTSQEMEYVASSVKILKMSSLFGIVAGAIWFFMPKAAEDSHEDTVATAKEFVKEPISVLINRTIEEQKEFIKELKTKKYNTSTTGWIKPSSTSTYTTSVAASVKINAPQTGRDINRVEEPDPRLYTATYQRGFEKVKRDPDPPEEDYDNDIPGEDDYEFDEIEDSIFQDELDDYLTSLERT